MILGADGYLGWPTAVDLAFKDHELMLVDNYVKRNIMTRFYIANINNSINYSNVF